jgi:hypothetical protein
MRHQYLTDFCYCLFRAKEEKHFWTGCLQSKTKVREVLTNISTHRSLWYDHEERSFEYEKLFILVPPV